MIKRRDPLHSPPLGVTSPIRGSSTLPGMGRVDLGGTVGGGRRLGARRVRGRRVRGGGVAGAASFVEEMSACSSAGTHVLPFEPSSRAKESLGPSSFGANLSGYKSVGHSGRTARALRKDDSARVRDVLLDALWGMPLELVNCSVAVRSAAMTAERRWEAMRGVEGELGQAKLEGGLQSDDRSASPEPNQRCTIQSDACHSHMLPSSTSPIHTSHTHLLCHLSHISHSHLPCTPSIHLSFTPPKHLPHTFHALPIHTSHPYFPSTLPIHTSYPHFLSTRSIHTSHPHLPSTPPIHTTDPAH